MLCTWVPWYWTLILLIYGANNHTLSQLQALPGCQHRHVLEQNIIDTSNLCSNHSVRWNITHCVSQQLKLHKCLAMLQYFNHIVYVKVKMVIELYKAIFWRLFSSCKYFGGTIVACFFNLPFSFLYSRIWDISLVITTLDSSLQILFKFMGPFPVKSMDRNCSTGSAQLY